MCIKNYISLKRDVRLHLLFFVCWSGPIFNLKNLPYNFRGVFANIKYTFTTYFFFHKKEIRRILLIERIFFFFNSIRITADNLIVVIIIILILFYYNCEWLKTDIYIFLLFQYKPTGVSVHMIYNIWNDIVYKKLYFLKTLSHTGKIIRDLYT